MQRKNYALDGPSLASTNREACLTTLFETGLKILTPFLESIKTVMQANWVNLWLLLARMGEIITWGLMARKARPWFDSYNSTCPRRRTPLILYLGAEVMPRCPSRAQSLPVGIGASAPKDSLSSASLYSFSPSLSLRGEYSLLSSSSLSTLWSSSYCCSSAGAPWAARLLGTTSSISKGSSSWDARGGESWWGSCGGGMFRGANWPVGWRQVLLRAVRPVRAIYHWNKKSVR
jgi:hypothetical protein